jgi:hypothetical protein
MELLRGLHNLKKEHSGCVLSIGVGFNKSNGIHLDCSACLLKLQLTAIIGKNS